MSCSIGINSSRLTTRFALVTKRESSESSLTPNTWKNKNLKQNKGEKQ